MENQVCLKLKMGVIAVPELVVYLSYRKGPAMVAVKKMLAVSTCHQVQLSMQSTCPSQLIWQIWQTLNFVKTQMY